MIDFDILEQEGTTNERLREFFTAKLPSLKRRDALNKTPEGRKQLKEMEKDVEYRNKFEVMIRGWLQEGIVFSLKTHAMYSAVDMAWDSQPINKNIWPLMQYAQGRIDTAKAVTLLRSAPGGASYIKKNEAGEESIDLPKFTEVNINLIRSVINRRCDALDENYELWPWFKYEPRDTTQVGKLRGDLSSQRMDIMADDYAYRHNQSQVAREMLLYGNVVSFPRAFWERDVQWQRKAVAPELDSGKIEKESKVVREGISWVNPHRSRLSYDNNYALSSLNTDTGCEYIYYWDVMRWGDISKNPDYFNRENVGFSANLAAWYTTYAAYFNQYFDTISLPQMPPDASGNNDRKNNVGFYTGQMSDVSTFFTHLWVKVKPQNWRMGKYPYDVWLHLKVAGDATVVHANIMPSSPAAVASYHENDSRMTNISFAHELMPFQDQLTNLFSQLLMTAKQDLFSVAVLNVDLFPDTSEGRKIREDFKKILQGKNYYADMQVLEVNLTKLSQVLMKEVRIDDVFKVVRSEKNMALTNIFQTIVQTINLAEALFVMSKNEQGKSESHEMSATESVNIATSVNTIEKGIYRAIDEYRSAQKRICFESLIACGSNDLPTLPVKSRYTDAVIQKAGFKVVERDTNDPTSFVTVMGGKYNLLHDYMFTSRDGSNRPNMAQSAQALVQLMTPFLSSNPAAANAILSAMGKTKLFEIYNTIFRMVDAGADLRLEVKPGESDELLPDQDAQVIQSIQQLAQQVLMIEKTIGMNPNGQQQQQPQAQQGQ